MSVNDLAARDLREFNRNQPALQGTRGPEPDIGGQFVQESTAMNEVPTDSRPPRLDRRVARTRESLRDALLELLAERGWDGIDIHSLCDRANVGRSTFYQHFPNKEELLKISLAGLRTELRETVRRLGDGPPDQLGFVGGLLEHVHRQQAVFRAVLGRRSGLFVQDRFRELLVDLVLEERSVGSGRTWQAGALAHYLAGALFQLLVWWLGANRPHRPKEIEALFHMLSKPVLQAARQAGSSK
jgi:AcrR family transcriptional regulator